jgi:aminoglycoside phosphotransferase (APT) family kinase protein
MSVDQLDIAKLGDYLDSQIEEFSSLQAAEKFPGGQSNPTYLLTADSGKYVLRRKPPGKLLKSAHAIDREFRVISALADSNVPVAMGYHLCEDDDVIGSMFYVMSFVDGRIFWDPALPDLANADRTAIYDEMNRVLAELHRVDVDAVGLSDYGKPGNYFERQVSRWTRQYLAAETETIEPMDALMRWLPEHMPADDGQVALVHGDYRLDNMIFHPTEPRILAIVDWELSTLGHPFADLAYQCMQWRLPNTGISRGLADIDRKAMGIPTEAEYVEAYCRRTGRDGISDWTFCLAFSFFRLASIVQGIFKRALDGNASNTQAMQMGKMARPLAQAAIDLIDDAKKSRVTTINSNSQDS